VTSPRIPTPGAAIRPVRPEDVPAVVAMVHELAEFERAPDECHLTDADLQAALFGPAPALYGHVALDPTGEPVGFALWFLNFSTWEGVHGVYLEDLYVRPVARGQGVGAALLSTLARVCLDRGYRRLEWWVLDWNEGARRLYHRLGATPMTEWTVHRVTGDALSGLAASTAA
jgi:GNAT superfamily N-acetyltransferase